MKNIWNSLISSYSIINECEVDGVRFVYDACSSNELKDAIEFYTNFIYIGSGYRTWHNSTENNWKELHHFFVRKNRYQEIKKLFREKKLKKIRNVTSKN